MRAHCHWEPESFAADCLTVVLCSGSCLPVAAGVGAGLSNVLNNLPVYMAGEAAVPVGNHHRLLALLIGTNVGPLVTPWASLATLLWFERCRGQGTVIPLRRFMGTGLVLAVTATLAATAALAVG